LPKQKQISEKNYFYEIIQFIALHKRNIMTAVLQLYFIVTDFEQFTSDLNVCKVLQNWWNIYMLDLSCILQHNKYAKYITILKLTEEPSKTIFMW